MAGTGKSAVHYRTVTILMAAVLVLSLALYVVSERFLRRAMVKPIRREKVDFSKALDWLPPKTRKELEYRARYLDLKQKYEKAEKEPEKFNASYQLAIHTRDIDEQNRLLLPYISHPEKYASLPGIHRAYVQMLYDPKNPKAISIRQYHDFLNTKKDPLEIWQMWKDGRDRLQKVAGKDRIRVTAEFLKPLLDKPSDYFIIRDYTWILSTFRDSARRLSLQASRRIADKNPREDDAETASSMMQLSLKAEELRKRITADPNSYNRGEYIGKEKARCAYEASKPGQDPLKTGFEYARRLKDPAKRAHLIRELLARTSAAEDHPLRLKLYALQADRIGAGGGFSSPEEYLSFAETLKTPAGVFVFWRETVNRLNSVRAGSAEKLRLLSPLLRKDLNECSFRDYAAFYDQIARCAVYLNRQDMFEKASAMRDAVRKKGCPSFSEYQKKTAEKQKKK